MKKIEQKMAAVQIIFLNFPPKMNKRLKALACFDSTEIVYFEFQIEN